VLLTRRNTFGRSEGLIGGALPGYTGHVPGRRHECETFATTFARGVDVSRALRSRATCDAQALRIARDKESRTPSAASAPRAPLYDTRGVGYRAAGDVAESRIPVSGEVKDSLHLHSTLGLTSFAHEGREAPAQLQGFSRASRGIPGYLGWVPGKVSENTYAETWSKSAEKSLVAHCTARDAAPRSDAVKAKEAQEVPRFNPSYQDRVRGWSTCEYTGMNVEAAGRLPPAGRQEAFGAKAPRSREVWTHGIQAAAIPGYTGWAPGRVGENVFGERQCQARIVADHLFKKNRVRSTQR